MILKIIPASKASLPAVVRGCALPPGVLGLAGLHHGHGGGGLQ